MIPICCKGDGERRATVIRRDHYSPGAFGVRIRHRCKRQRPSFFRVWIRGHSILAGTIAIHEIHDDVRTDVLDETIEPLFERVRGYHSAALLRRTSVSAAAS